MEKFKSIIRDYPFIAFIIAFIILAFVPSVVFTDVYQSHLATLIFVNIAVAAGLNIVKGYCGQVIGRWLICSWFLYCWNIVFIFRTWFLGNFTHSYNSYCILE